MGLSLQLYVLGVEGLIPHFFFWGGGGGGGGFESFF